MVLSWRKKIDRGIMDTWKKRRRGLGGPLEAWEGCEEDWLHATLPSLPALTLQPETTSSRNHKSGFFCHSTNPPTSQLCFAFVLSRPWWMSDDTIFTCPTAYMLRSESSAACPPVAARYWCTMYFAVEASCFRKRGKSKQRKYCKRNKVLFSKCWWCC